MFTEKLMGICKKKPYSKKEFDDLDEKQKALKNAYESVINKGSGVDESPQAAEFVDAKIQERRDTQAEMRRMKEQAHGEALKINEQIDKEKIEKIREDIKNS
jgi:CRISPR/Cas system CMR-associated protein Cmr5 small subunit